MSLLRIFNGPPIFLVFLVICVVMVDSFFPPPIERVLDQGVIVTDRHGEWLHAFSNDQKRWRFAVALEEIDPGFLKHLIAIEDERFFLHPGIDPLAIGRAIFDAGRAGHIVSGASTITMQTARLLEPRKRTLGAKIIEMLRALQLERRLTKNEILELYLTVTPYGGNLEGIRAASLFYFAKEPINLSIAEQALLIALPQAPEARRPDRKGENAKVSRYRILNRLRSLNFIDKNDAEREATAPLPRRRHIYRRHAYHASRAAVQADHRGPTPTIQTTINLKTQISAERLITQYASENFDDGATAAAIVIDNVTGEIRALIGSSGIDVPGGWIDLTQSKRSPGSLLKPFIYGVAFDDGVLGPDTLVSDRPRAFGGYRPENFDRNFRGDVRVREALQYSLNIPAVDALARVGASRFVGKLWLTGSRPKQQQGADQHAGLAIALGGVGISLLDISSLYLSLANHGAVMPVTLILSKNKTDSDQKRLLSVSSANRINAILRGAPSLSGRGPAFLSKNAPIVAYKTGTSYGYRDAWAAGHAGDLTIAVWTGRADGAPRPGKTGRNTAAPLLFQLFDQLGQPANSKLTVTDDAPYSSPRRRDTVVLKPQILFPKNGVDLLIEPGSPKQVMLAAHGGDGALVWYVDGVRAPDIDGRSVWVPEGEGFFELKVFDRSGAFDVSKVRIVSR